MMRAPVLLSLSLIVSGCIAQPQPPEAVAAAPFDGTVEPPQIVCRKEKPTGSNRPVTVCREVQSALDRENTRRDMNVLQRQSELLGQDPP
jgi:hypothetical protein